MEFDNLHLICDSCASNNVCMYKEDFLNTKIETKHPYISFSCSEYIQKAKIKNKDIRKRILKWRELHPDGKKINCARDTGISRPTIDKYWNDINKGDENVRGNVE